jgi:NAD(P)-dependent dehydrogenase (short-subunit alcohol dehydrogenase family)
VRDPAAVAAAVDQIEAQLGLPNVVIHNAAGTAVFRIRDPLLFYPLDPE